MKNIKDASKTEFEIDYRDLPVTGWVQVEKAVLYPTDYAHPAEYEEIEDYVDYTFRVSDEEVFEYFWEHPDLYDELKGFEKDSEELSDYINENLEDLFDDHVQDLADHFESEAIKEAEENYEPPEEEW